MKRQTTQIGFRMATEITDIVREVSQARGEDVSDFIRRSILWELAYLNFLPDRQKKALGVKTPLIEAAKEEDDSE